MGRGSGEAGCVGGGAGHGVLEELENGYGPRFVRSCKLWVWWMGLRGEDGEKVWRGDDPRRDDEYEISSIDS